MIQLGLDTINFALGENFEYICISRQDKEELTVSLIKQQFLSKQMFILTGQYFHECLNAYQQMSDVTVTYQWQFPTTTLVTKDISCIFMTCYTICFVSYKMPLIAHFIFLFQIIVTFFNKESANI